MAKGSALLRAMASLRAMSPRECLSWGLVLGLSILLIARPKDTPLVFPDQGPHSGNCLCNAEAYCVCTPNLAVDIIIEADESENSPVVSRKSNCQCAPLVSG